MTDGWMEKVKKHLPKDVYKTVPSGLLYSSLETMSAIRGHEVWVAAGVIIRNGCRTT